MTEGGDWSDHRPGGDGWTGAAVFPCPNSRQARAHKSRSPSTSAIPSDKITPSTHNSAQIEPPHAPTPPAAVTPATDRTAATIETQNPTSGFRSEEFIPVYVSHLKLVRSNDWLGISLSGTDGTLTRMEYHYPRPKHIFSRPPPSPRMLSRGTTTWGR